LLVAACVTGADAFVPLAAAAVDDIFTQPFGNATNPLNGAERYCRPSHSAGFPGLGDTVSLNHCDTNIANASLRFCLHLNPLGAGGHRIGGILGLNDFAA
jgi:hypothetical protein